jgi:hypothetical protein
MGVIVPVQTGRKTDQTRAWAEQVYKLQWLWRLKGVSSADFIGPLIAKKLDAAFEEIRETVQQLQPTVGGEG